MFFDVAFSSSCCFCLDQEPWGNGDLVRSFEGWLGRRMLAGRVLGIEGYRYLTRGSCRIMGQGKVLRMRTGYGTLGKVEVQV